MDARSPAALRNAQHSGFPASKSGVNHVEDSFLGAPSSSFLNNVGVNPSSSSSSFSYTGKVLNQGSSDSGNFFRASQPTTSVLGIPEQDRLFIKNRYGPKPRMNSSRSPSQLAPGLSRGTVRGAAQEIGGEVTRGARDSLRGAAAQEMGGDVSTRGAQQRRVLARLNPTGSQIKDTRLPSPIVVNTLYSKTGDIRSGVSRQKRVGQGKQSNQNNASAEDGKFSRRNLAHGAGEEAMDTSKTGAPTSGRPDAASSDMSTGMSLMMLHQQWERQQGEQGLQQQQQQRKVDQGESQSKLKQLQQRAQRQQQWMEKKYHAHYCNANFNAEAPCNCPNEKGKLSIGMTTDIIPQRRPKKSTNVAQNFNEADCGESPWDWYVDAKWGCQQYPDVYYCDEDCPSLLEYLLCPESEDCDEDDDQIEWTRSADDEPDLEAVISLRQGETADQEVRNVNIVKKGQDDFTVSWKHPPGRHETYVVVVYPPIENSGNSTPRGPDCTSCAGNDDCICAEQPIFRMHVDGSQTECDFPAECLEAGKSFYVEVATLNQARDQSFGTSLVQIDVYQLDK